MISLEDKIAGLESEVETVKNSFAGCKAENARLREALQEIIDMEIFRGAKEAFTMQSIAKEALNNEND